MKIEEIRYLIVEFEMAVDKLARYMYGHDDCEGESNPDEMLDNKRKTYEALLEGIKKYKGQK